MDISISYLCVRQSREHIAVGDASHKLATQRTRAQSAQAVQRSTSLIAHAPELDEPRGLQIFSWKFRLQKRFRLLSFDRPQIFAYGYDSTL